MVDVIGILSGIITIASFISENQPDPDHYYHRIRIGQRSEDSGGWVPEVTFRNAYGADIAKSGWENNWVEPGRIGEEEFGDDTAQVDEIQVLAGNNAVCFVWHEFHDSDGTDPIVMFGEVLKYCGAPWYPSDIRADLNGVNDYRDCAWLNDCTNDDGGCANDAWSGYNLVNLVYWSNVRSGAGEADPNDVCNQIWSFHPSARRRAFSNHLATDVVHTSRRVATSICQSATSLGQSLVSTSEGLFCDMTTKTLYPLCRPDMVQTCFDIETSELQTRDSGEVSVMRTGSAQAVNTSFRPSPVSIDGNGETDALRKRNDALEEFVLNGSMYYHSNETQCDDCCLSVTDASSQYNETHYFGPLVDEAVEYTRISNGISFQREEGNAIVLDCPAGFDTTNLYRGSVVVDGAEGLATSMTMILGGTALAGVAIWA